VIWKESAESAELILFAKFVFIHSIFGLFCIYSLLVQHRILADDPRGSLFLDAEVPENNEYTTMPTISPNNGLQ
jgi:hypothetical protein